MEQSTCSVEGCERPRLSRGWCSTHYARWQRNGEPGGAAIANNGKPKPGPEHCTVDGCKNPTRVKERGLCLGHYRRWQRYGDPLAEGPRREKWVAGHGLTGYDCHSCRCEVCKSAKSESQRQLKDRLKGDLRTPHGTVRGYNGWACRCEECREAMRQAQAQEEVRERRAEVVRRSRMLLQGTDPPEHGVSGYTNRGCRCEVCTEAAKSASYRRVEKDRQVVPHAPRSVERDQWTGAELEFVLTRRDLDDRTIAKRLGRTVKAVRGARYRASHDPKWIKVAGVANAQVD